MQGLGFRGLGFIGFGAEVQVEFGGFGFAKL